MGRVQREQVGLTVKELVDSWGGSEPVQVPPGTGEGPVESPPNPIDPVDPVNEDVPLAELPTNTATVQPPVVADNNLLLFGGLAAFYLVAFAPFGKKKITGVPGPSWLLPGVLLGGALLAYKAFSRPPISEQLAVVNSWADINAADSTSTKAIFTRMTPAELYDTYRYISEYVTQEIPLPETNPLWPRIVDIAKKYNIFS